MQMGGFVSLRGDRVPFMARFARYKLLSTRAQSFLSLCWGVERGIGEMGAQFRRSLMGPFT